MSGVGLAHPAVLRPRSAAVSFLFQPTFRRGLALGCLQDLGTLGAEFKKDSQFRIGTFPQCKAVDGCSSTKERKVVEPAPTGALAPHSAAVSWNAFSVLTRALSLRKKCHYLQGSPRLKVARGFHSVVQVTSSMW